MYRMIEFGQEHKGIKGKVAALEYDPNRTSRIALVNYENGTKAYIIAPENLKAGDEVLCDDKTEIKIGNRLMLKHVSVGTMVHNVELEPGRGGKIVRGAGAGATVLAQEGNCTHLQLPSSEVRKVLDVCFATVGTVSNPEHMYKRIHNAGRARLMGWRPTVRGTVMNPVDHPHGGGEGRQGIGLVHPKTPWGKPALGVKTRGKKWSDKYILERRKKKKK